MSESDPIVAGAQRPPELVNPYRGLRMGEFFAMSDAEMERAVELLLADDRGLMGFSALEFLEELDRRATKRHTKQVEEYAKRLDRLTIWLVVLTAVLIILEVRAVV